MALIIDRKTRNMMAEITINALNLLWFCNIFLMFTKNSFISLFNIRFSGEHISRKLKKEEKGNLPLNSFGFDSQSTGSSTKEITGPMDRLVHKKEGCFCCFWSTCTLGLLPIRLCHSLETRGGGGRRHRFGGRPESILSPQTFGRRNWSAGSRTPPRSVQIPLGRWVGVQTTIPWCRRGGKTPLNYLHPPDTKP